MKLTRHEYATQSAKRNDFIIGFLAWYALNLVLWAVVGIMAGVVFSILPPQFEPTQNTNSTTLWFAATSVITCGLPLLLNLGALLYFGRTRRWIALGALAAFAVVLLFILIVGLIVAVLCFNPGH
jgi:hypothetical protein